MLNQVCFFFFFVVFAPRISIKLISSDGINVIVSINLK